MKPKFIFVGIGNPGKTYEKTRHNVGFMALDHLAKEYGAGDWVEQQKFTSDISEVTIEGVDCYLVKPRTYMNRSGEAIAKLVGFFKLNPATQLLVICDDIDLPLGTHRLRMKGGPGTHNGLKSIIESNLSENFPRLRIGLGKQPEGMDLAAFVLSKFSPEELKTLQPSFEYLATLSKTILREIKQGPPLKPLS
jgi:peptidyl-tRNA hydrolase, PTH1 family